MDIKRKGSAGWTGDFKDGRGTISTASGALDGYPYGFSSRFGGVAGSNPEELLAAAHAACFTMALSLALGEAGLVADRMDTTAEVTLSQGANGFSIPTVHLSVNAIVPGTDAATFTAIANGAKAGCPVSKLFNADITLDASLMP